MEGNQQRSENNNVSTPDEWKRTGNKELDQLHFYITGELYDCSFEVGRNKSEYKIFKCHKMILKMSSVVFQKMFAGNFKEASLDKDNPIKLDKFSPTAFDIAMKFIYGNCQAFEDVLTAVQVYRFAHEMQIPCLMAPLDEFLKSNTSPANVFAVLDLYTLLENDQHLNFYWDILHLNAREAFESTSWMLVGPLTVEKVMQVDVLLIEEFELFQRLLLWGKFQVLRGKKLTDVKQVNNVEDKAVREKIDPFLKYVQFKTMEICTFAEICKTSNVLTNDEKLKIFMVMVLKSPDCMPDVLPGALELDRCTPIALPYYEMTPNPNHSYRNSTVSFYLDREAHLVGVQVEDSDLNYGNDLQNVTITLSEPYHSKIFDNLSTYESRGRKIIKLETILLKKSTTYVLTFIKKCETKVNKTYTITSSKYKPLKYPALTVTLTTQNSQVNLSAMIFRPVNEVKKPK